MNKNLHPGSPKITEKLFSKKTKGTGNPHHNCFTKKYPSHRARERAFNTGFSLVDFMQHEYGTELKAAEKLLERKKKEAKNRRRSFIKRLFGFGKLTKETK